MLKERLAIAQSGSLLIIFTQGRKLLMSQIQIADLIDNAVENALARREQILTTEKANQIQGGFKFRLPIIKPIKPPIILGMIPPRFPIGKLIFK